MFTPATKFWGIIITLGSEGGIKIVEWMLHNDVVLVELLNFEDG